MEGVIQLIFALLTPLGLLGLGIAAGGHAERKHLQSLAVREEQLGHIMQTSLRHVPRNWRVSQSALVQGQAVIASDYFKTFMAGLRNFFGGEVRSLETLMARARREATVRMLAEADSMGANAVFCIRMETSTVGRGSAKKGLAMAEVFVYGTALKVER